MTQEEGKSLVKTKKYKICQKILGVSINKVKACTLLM